MEEKGKVVKKTTTAIGNAEQALRRFTSGRATPWTAWTEMTNLTPEKNDNLIAASERLQHAAALHDRHPDLRAELARMVELVFAIAARGLHAYAEYKRHRGVIDFIDQEQLALRLLAEPSVREQLSGRLDLVLVDEFQDTSPIQLAIFLQLAKVAKKTVWVGDQKQSIYGFRGTDPAIMDAAIEAVLAGEEPKTLEKSWRSRPELVRTTSAVFAESFRGQGIPPSRVRLEPARTEEPSCLGPYLEYWAIAGQNKSIRLAALAAAVRTLLTEEPTNRVRTSDHRVSRDIRPGDVAVLCRSNAECHDLAGALGEIGVPAVLARPGLMSTPEGLISLAALRLFVDGRDSLARAQLARFLCDPEDSAKWLQNLLDTPKARGFDDLPPIARVLEARGRFQSAGALAALDAAMDAVGVRELCLQWGDAPGRLANLDRLRAHAMQYCSLAQSEGRGVTPTGLVRHLEQIQDPGWSKEPTDEKAAVASADAVVLSTWHAAKGLEWPVTILTGLDNVYENSALGVNVATDREQIDLNDPLADRWIRYWPYPYGGKSKNIEMRTRLTEHPVQKAKDVLSLAQELRVLYVGWTRARDRLVLVSKPGELPRGLLSLLQSDGEPVITEPDGDTITWADRTFTYTRREPVPVEPVAHKRRPGSAVVPAGPKAHPPAVVYPSEMTRPGHVGVIVAVGDPIPISGEPNMADLGEAIHGFLAADVPGPAEHRLQMATDLLERWRVAGAIEPPRVVAAGDAIRAWADEHYPGARWRREWPIRHRLEDGSTVRGFIDLVLETDGELFVIDHKSFPGRLRDQQERVQKYAGQLGVYRDALGAATGMPVTAAYIYLPISGKVVEVV